MKNWWHNFRRKWFLTREEEYQNGRDFAERHFVNAQNEDEFEMLYEALPFTNVITDPFDRAILDYAREVNWGAK